VPMTFISKSNEWRNSCAGDLSSARLIYSRYIIPFFSLVDALGRAKGERVNEVPYIQGRNFIAVSGNVFDFASFV